MLLMLLKGGKIFFKLGVYHNKEWRLYILPLLLFPLFRGGLFLLFLFLEPERFCEIKLLLLLLLLLLVVVALPFSAGGVVVAPELLFTLALSPSFLHLFG